MEGCGSDSDSGGDGDHTPKKEFFLALHRGGGEGGAAEDETPSTSTPVLNEYWYHQLRAVPGDWRVCLCGEAFGKSSNHSRHGKQLSPSMNL